VRVQVMLADIADWPRFNEIYREYFAEPFPARSAFAANGLALGALVEVEAFAVKRSS
jgi:enamine deaminase RidA (YjgF/YER057c/UK114 family)